MDLMRSDKNMNEPLSRRTNNISSSSKSFSIESASLLTAQSISSFVNRGFNITHFSYNAYSMTIISGSVGIVDLLISISEVFVFFTPFLPAINSSTLAMGKLHFLVL